MITVYTATGCVSSRKAISWLKEHNLEYKEISLDKNGIDSGDFLKMLSLTEEGADELISQRSQAYKNIGHLIDTLPISKLVDLVNENRTILRRPLLVDDSRIQVGFNSDDIRQFLPRKIRKIELTDALETVKENYLKQERQEFLQEFAIA